MSKVYPIPSGSLAVMVQTMPERKISVVRPPEKYRVAFKDNVLEIDPFSVDVETPPLIWSQRLNGGFTIQAIREGFNGQAYHVPNVENGGGRVCFGGRVPANLIQAIRDFWESPFNTHLVETNPAFSAAFARLRALRVGGLSGEGQRLYDAVQYALGDGAWISFLDGSADPDHCEVLGKYGLLNYLLTWAEPARPLLRITGPHGDYAIRNVPLPVEDHRAVWRLLCTILANTRHYALVMQAYTDWATFLRRFRERFGFGYRDILNFRQWFSPPVRDAQVTFSGTLQARVPTIELRPPSRDKDGRVELGQTRYYNTRNGHANDSDSERIEKVIDALSQASHLLEGMFSRAQLNKAFFALESELWGNPDWLKANTAPEKTSEREKAVVAFREAVANTFRCWAVGNAHDLTGCIMGSTCAGADLTERPFNAVILVDEDKAHGSDAKKYFADGYGYQSTNGFTTIRTLVGFGFRMDDGSVVGTLRPAKEGLPEVGVLVTPGGEPAFVDIPPGK